jgi:Zn finger protein HypA/HybF (possibly regulating hydrogenase expression)
MHDYQVVATLVERLTDQLDDRDRVTEVRIRANPIFSPDALEQAFEMLTGDTRLEGSRLLIEKSDDCECPACGASWTPTHDDLVGSLVVCPTCGAPSPMQGHMGIEVVGIA